VVASVRPRPTASLFAACAGALLLGAIVHAAWLCDDAFITLRSVDNWVHGYGLRWNVDERVQSFTHPAWLFLVTGAYLPTHNPTFALLLPALAATTAFIVCFLRGGNNAATRGALCLLLLASKAFVEFSTSGLENPLVHLLLLGCLAATRSAKSWALIASSALLLLTRMDLIWLIGPTLCVALWRARRELRQPRAWWALGPLIAWELFSLVYYGFPFPNTAYAKLSTAVPAAEAIAHGFSYLGANLEHDPITLPAIGVAVLCGLAARRLRPALLALGLLGWLAYLVRIGGDFMLGRLLTPALVVAAVSISELAPPLVARFLPWVGALLVGVSAVQPRTALRGAPAQTDKGWLPRGVTDERAIFHATTGLFRASNSDGPRSHEYTLSVLEAAARGQRVIAAGSIGFAGYFAGPSVHIVDQFALADPLLARLPADPAWNAGHFFRQLPDGYLATLESGENQLGDGKLAVSYSDLHSIIADPIFNYERLARILRWNLAPQRIYPFDYQVSHIPREGMNTLPGGGSSVQALGVLTTNRQGLALDFAPPAAVHGASLALGADDHYLIVFRRGHHVLWQTSLTPSEPDRQRLTDYTVSAPRELNVDSVLIVGRRGDGNYHVGAVNFN
jgi:arabinofuranosyltransferase